MSEKCGEKMAKFFADFRPSISRKSGRKKFHETLATNSAGREMKFFTARLWEFGGARLLARRKGVSRKGAARWGRFELSQKAFII